MQHYPIELDMRLEPGFWIRWDTRRWIASRLHKLASWEVQGMARALFDLAMLETPPGTLPDDDRELAAMLRCDSFRIRDLRAMDIGPFYNWTRCRCGDGIRLMHPVVLESVQDALRRGKSAGGTE